MPKPIVILDDDQDRLDRMEEIFNHHYPELPVVKFTTEEELITYVDSGVAKPIVISLDHDLGQKDSLRGKSTIPGTGAGVAIRLMRKEPICPVIVHSANSVEAEGMVDLLQAGGWQVYRVCPTLEDWIETCWFEKVQSLLKGQRINDE